MVLAIVRLVCDRSDSRSDRSDSRSDRSDSRSDRSDSRSDRSDSRSDRSDSRSDRSDVRQNDNMYVRQVIHTHSAPPHTLRKMGFKFRHTSGIGQYLSRWKVNFI